MSEEAKPPLIKASDLTEVVSRYMSAEDISKVYNAFLLAAEAHDGVVRKSGEFYIFHPLEVAHTLAEFHMDADTVCAALLSLPLIAHTAVKPHTDTPQTANGTPPTANCTPQK